MALLENVQCPVCGKLFEEGDDVVFCPDCGTPHHRACYQLAGHCVNQGLHKSGYNFYDAQQKAAAKQSAQAVQAEKTETDAPNAPKQESPFGDFNVSMDDRVKELEEKLAHETINELPAKYFAAAIGNNFMRFFALFRRFEKGGKTSWNWAALIFGPYYLLFRKMYGYGIALLCTQTVISYLGGYLLALKAPAFTAKLQELTDLSQNSVFQANTLDPTVLQNTADFQTATYITMGVFAALVLLRVCVALFADKMYYHTLCNLIKNVTSEDENSVSFSVLPGMRVTAQQNFDGKSGKFFYLMRKGGTSLFAPMLAYFAVKLIQQLLQQL